MSKVFIGTVQSMDVIKKTDQGYMLENDNKQVLLPIDEVKESDELEKTIQVFIYSNKDGESLATPHLPTAELDVYGWGKVVEVIPNLGAFVDIDTAIEVLVSMDDLPIVQEVLPAAGDKLYVRLKKDKKDRLIAVPANENEFTDLFEFATSVELNDRVNGTVIRTGREGTVIITEDNYRAFIHHTERKKEPRLGESVNGRVIEVKEDGSLNVSLLPLKHERIDDDAERIFAYLEANGDDMPFGNKTDPEVIQDTFSMSKSAFKRALGRLMKEGKIEQQEGKTYKI